MPPAKAFWSATLYDMQNGFFIPNDRKKYRVRENAVIECSKGVDGKLILQDAEDGYKDFRDGLG